MESYKKVIIATVVVIIIMIIFFSNKAKAVVKDVLGDVPTTPQDTDQQLCDLLGYFVQENGKIYKIWKDVGQVKKLEVTLYNQGYNPTGTPVSILTDAEFESGKANAYIPDYQWYRDDVKNYCPNK